MKIGVDAHTLEENRTGVGRYLFNLLEKASQTEWIKNNFVFYLYFKKEIPRDLLFDQPIFVKKLLNLPFNRSSFFVFFLFLLPRALKKDKIDLAFFPSYMIPLTFRSGGIMTIHDISYEDHPELYPWRYLIPYKIFSRFGARRAEKILTVSNFSKNRIMERYQIKPEKIIVTPLAVRDEFKPISEPSVLESVKKKYRIKNKFILQLGQIFARRYVFQTILAFGQIAENFPEHQLLIVGKNRTKPFIDIDKTIKETNQRLGKEAILRLDYAAENDLPALYGAAEVSVYLSDYEGFGLPPLEAMACGTPSITTNLTALAETAGDSAAIVNNPKDIEEIAAVLSRCLLSPSFRAKLIEKGFENVKRFSWQKCAEQTFRVFMQYEYNANDANGTRMTQIK